MIVGLFLPIGRQFPFFVVNHGPEDLNAFQVQRNLMRMIPLTVSQLEGWDTVDNVWLIASAKTMYLFIIGSFTQHTFMLRCS